MKVVVTGASKGIGKAIACAFAREGASVAVCARTAEELEQTRQELERIAPGREHLAVQADCSDKTQFQVFCEQVRNRYGILDVLVNNVGLFREAELLEGPEELLEEMLGLNLWPAYLGSRFFARGMKARQRGHIFNICSVAGLRAVPGAGAYTVSKHAMLGLSRALRLELKTFGVKVTSVIPGSTRTASWEDTPVDTGKFVTAADVASAVVNSWRLGPHSTIEELLITPTEL